jgi:hypothetical protein
VLLFEEADAGLPPALLVVVVFWLTVLFAGFTLFSPINATSATVAGDHSRFRRRGRSS